MAKPDYGYMTKKSLEAYDIMSKLTFEVFADDKIGLDLISRACSAIAELYRYSKEKESATNSKVQETPS